MGSSAKQDKFRSKMPTRGFQEADRKFAGFKDVSLDNHYPLIDIDSRTILTTHLLTHLVVFLQAMLNRIRQVFMDGRRKKD